MPGSISLALVIHNHQPVGNFGWVIEDVYEHAYAPMLAALERHPEVHVALHYTGPLLEWIVANQPDFIERLRTLVDRGQVEILGGGLYEPVLAALPQRDRHGQLERMRHEVARLFGREPTGAWLAERVWEPALAGDLAEAGYRYTVLDDNHLRGATVPEDEMWGTYTTDDRGRMLTIFGTEKGLRYRIPWRPVSELIDYLREHATDDGRLLGTMGDDGEKFGAWPGTYELCWGEQGWVDECFTALAQNRDWLHAVTPTEWMERQPPRGRIYVPTASYVEMTEWALPPAEARTFHQLLAEADEARSPAARFLRGAMWRNFQARYREINDLHKQMLATSDAVDAMPAGERRDRALDHLYRAQSNDCYWHGLFGGIYIVHMRMATYHHLLAAADLASEAEAASGVGDFDLDGIDEVLLGTTGQSVLIDAAEGAGVGAWDLRASRVALASVLRRRPEAYHADLREMEAAAAREERSGVASPHETFMTKEKGLSRFLVYDDHERRSGLVRLRSDARDDARETGDFVSGAWQLTEATPAAAAFERAADGMHVRKSVELGGDRREGTLSLAVEARNDAAAGFAGTLEMEWNLNLLGGGGNPDAYYAWDDEEDRHDSRGSVDAGTELRMGNRREGVELRVDLVPPAEQSWQAVETVSNSEGGFERVYQGSCLLQRWPLRLAPGESATFRATFMVSQARDYAEEEAAPG